MVVVTKVTAADLIYLPPDNGLELVFTGSGLAAPTGKVGAGMEVNDQQEKEMRNRADYIIINNSNSNRDIAILGGGPVPEIAPTHQVQAGDDVDLDSPKATKPAAATLTAASARYMECHRNHAASVGGLVLDGCREFMQSSGEDGSPESLRCAACNCHRNFHRNAYADMRYAAAGAAFYCRSSAVKQQQPHRLPPPLPSPIFLHRHHQQQKIMPPGSGLHHAHPMSVAFGGGAESSSEDASAWQMQAPAAGAASSNKKRFRTKFTPEQKQKMVEFAEKVGWKIQNQDETEIQRFCAEVGVRRQVFKVWIHNNKNSLKQHPNNNNPDDQQQHQN